MTKSSAPSLAENLKEALALFRINATGGPNLDHATDIQNEVIESLESSAPELEENNLLDEIQRVFFPYHKPPERADPDLWLTIAQVQLKEIEFYLRIGDKDHAMKEFADLAFVAIDGLSKMGYNPQELMEKRLTEIKNSTGWHLAK